MTIREQIVECESRLLEALQQGNISVVEELLHDDLLFTIPTGQTVTKDMDLTNLRSGTLRIAHISASEQEIRVIDDVASVALTIQLKAEFGDAQIDGKFRYLRVWKLFGNSWKVIAGSGFQV